MQTVQQYLDRYLARIREWHAQRRARRQLLTLLVVPIEMPILREVSSQGIRILSLCATCGARLGRSATLCDDCARKRSPSAP